MIIVEPSVELLHHTPDAEKVIERSGRICWKSEGNMNADSHVAFIRMIKSKNHASVLEHATAGFVIVTDRGISHEAVRHRLASYSQASTRYCNYSKDKFSNQISVIVPDGIEPDTPEYRDWYEACEFAEKSYFSLLNRGVKPQIARSVLPTCLATEFAWTANLREWMHILDLRGSSAAHPDIRKIIEQIKPHLIRIAPTVFEEFK